MIDLFIHLLINERAGNDKAKKTVQIITKELKRLNIQYDSCVTKYAGHARELAMNLNKMKLRPWNQRCESMPFPLLVVLGGDGTIHEVINSVERVTPIGYIPCGTGNDFARAMGISLKPLEALENLLNCSETSCRTVLRYEQPQQKEMFAVNNIGLGLDANIVYSANHSRLKKILNVVHMGSFAYIATICHVLFRQQGFPIHIQVNSNNYFFSNAFLCTVSNHPYFGGGVKILPPASVNEEHVHLILVERISMIKIMYLITQLIRGKHLQSKYVSYFKGKTIKLNSSAQEYLQIDGEDSEKKAHDITVSCTHQEFWI